MMGGLMQQKLHRCRAQVANAQTNDNKMHQTAHYDPMLWCTKRSFDFFPKRLHSYYTLIAAGDGVRLN